MCRVSDIAAAWLKEQPWYGQFLDNMLNRGGLCTDADDGRYGKDTIRRAFVWKDTPEGFDFWERRSLELEKHLLNASDVEEDGG